MKFGIFYEHQLPRPWAEGDELRLFQEALDQVELADRLGFDFAWEMEQQEKLAPIIAEAMARKQGMPPLADAEIPAVEALGRSIVEDAKPSGARPASLGDSVRAELGVAK